MPVSATLTLRCHFSGRLQGDHHSRFTLDIDVRAKRAGRRPRRACGYRIIYDAVNDIKGPGRLLDAKIRKKFLGRVEIREVFKLSKQGTVAGCYVTKGRVTRKDHVDVVRNGEPVYTGTVSGLKRFKDDVKEVTEGTECGISFAGIYRFEAGDIIEATTKIAQKYDPFDTSTSLSGSGSVVSLSNHYAQVIGANDE